MRRHQGILLLMLVALSCAQAALCQLAGSSWPKFHRDYSSSGLGIYGGTESSPGWTFRAGGAIKSSPVTGADDTIYFTSADGFLYALDSYGAELWRTDCACSGTAAPAVGSDGTVYVASVDNSLRAVRPDGTLKWRKPLSARPETSIAIGRDGTVYVGCTNGAFYAFRPEGLQKWMFTAGGAIGSSPAVGSDGSIYFGCQDGKVYALTSSGTLKWKFSPYGAGAFYASPAVGSDGVIYVGSANGFFYAITPSGTQRWRAMAGGDIRSSAAVGADGTLYFGCRDGKVYALSSLGTHLWTFPTGQYVDASPAVGVDGVIFAPSLSGKIHALNPDGSENWFYEAGSGIYSSPAVAAEGALLVGSDSGILYCFASYSGIPDAPVVSDEGQFTTSTNKLSASWTTISYSSGVSGYEYSVGTAPGQTSVKGWTGVGLQTSVTDTGLQLAHATVYYVNVRARGSDGRAGKVGSSDGITVDTTPPLTPQASDSGEFTGSTTELSATWTCSDPESGIVGYLYAVGTAAGAADILGWTPAGTEASVLIKSLNLQNGGKYYVSVRAVNGAGTSGAAGSTDGITVDATPPTTPVVTDSGAYTTDPTRLLASWSASDAESGITKYEYSVGTSAGATDVLSWRFAGTATAAVVGNLSLQSGVKYFINIRATNGAQLVSATGSSDGIYLESTPPTKPAVSDDGAYTGNAGELRASWFSEDPETGIVKSEYSIGTVPGAADVWPWTDTGRETSLLQSGLSLQSGVTYYVNVRTTNALGMVSEVGVSDGITLDTTPPGAATVTDDGLYTADTSRLHAVVGCEDAESGIAYYECAAGTTPGGTDVAAWTDCGPGPDVQLGGLQLWSGVTYYISARAVNGAGVTGPEGCSDGIKLDTTPPVVSVVGDDGQFTGTADRLRGSWSAVDPESGIAGYRYCVGTAPGLDDVAGWMHAGTATQHTRENLSLDNGRTYYITVVATNGAGSESAPASSDGITLDLTPASTPVVTDNGQYWGYKTHMVASWSSEDSESGIISYRVSVGTSPGLADAGEWREVGPVTSADITGLQLQDGVTYYVNVQARNGGGVWSETGSSDGVLLDSTVPTTPSVVDDGDSTAVQDRLHASWHSEDPESGIAEYFYCIGTSPGATDVAPWTSAANREDVTVTGLKLEPMLTYYFSVKARSGAGAWSAAAASDGIGYSAGAAIWWKFRNGAANLGRQQFKGTKVAELGWEVHTSGYVESSPAIASDGTTYVGSGDGFLYAITQNGTVRWKFDTGGPVDSSPAVAGDGRILIGSNSGTLYCLSPAGEKVWSYRTGGPVRSSPLIAGDRVFVGSNDGKMHALSLSNGAGTWTFQTGGAVWSSPACDKQGNLYFASGDAYIYSLDSKGNLRWRYLTGTATDASPALADDGTLYVGSGDGYFYAIKPDGTLKWRYNAGTFCDSSAAVDENGNIYFGVGLDGGDGWLVALRPDGSEIWRMMFPMGGIISSPAIDSTGMIYVGSCDEHLYAINSEGTICWAYATTSSVASSPAIGADSSVVFGSFDGGIYCLRDSSAKDLTPPGRPVVTAPAAVGVNQPLTASWAAEDPDTAVAEYTYAVGTEPGATDICYWNSSGSETGVALKGLALQVGRTYYFSVRARNPSQRWSEVGFSQGTTVVSVPGDYSIAEAKRLPDQTVVSLKGKVVGAVFEDCFFVQEPNRAAGIKCACPNTQLVPGDIVDVSGSIGTLSGEKALVGLTYTLTGTGFPPSPLGVCGTIRNGMIPDPYGVAVRLWGRVTSSGQGYCIIEGLSGAKKWTESGVQICDADLSVMSGDYIVAEGVLSCEQIDGQAKTVLRIESPEKVSIRR